MKLIVSFIAAMISLVPTLVHAQEVQSYSRGNAFIYFMAIAGVLVFGIHDVFHNKKATWAAAILIPTVLYLLLPAK